MEIHILVVLNLILGPLLALFAWWNKKLDTRIDRLEQRFADVEITHAVHKTQLEEIKIDIDKIDIKLDKILERLGK